MLRCKVRPSQEGLGVEYQPLFSDARTMLIPWEALSVPRKFRASWHDIGGYTWINYVELTIRGAWATLVVRRPLWEKEFSGRATWGPGSAERRACSDGEPQRAPWAVSSTAWQASTLFVSLCSLMSMVPGVLVLGYVLVFLSMLLGVIALFRHPQRGKPTLILRVLVLWACAAFLLLARWIL